MSAFLTFIVITSFIMALISFFIGQSDENYAKFFPHLLTSSIIALLLRIGRSFFSDTTFITIVIFVALIGLLFYWYTYDHSIKSKVMCIFTASVVFIGTCLMGYTSFLADSYEKTSFNDELFYARTAGYVLAKYLNNKYPDSKIVIIVDDKENPSKLINSTLDGLLAGLNEKIHILAIDSPDFIPDIYQSTSDKTSSKKIPPERKIFYLQKAKAEHFDNLIYKYPECNLIISLIGLPSNPDEMHIWQIEESKRPKIVLLRADAKKYAQAVYMKAIDALVTTKPMKEKVKSKEKNFEKAFDERFLLLTPENITEIAKKHPEFFQE
ncbi:MAG TPA: hypothetical protein P5270_02710 [Victivallales bacterium]|nr:hypothetical protein [Victivallales bacterium]